MADPKSSANKHGGVTSIKVFRQFVERDPQGRLDGSKVISTACYKAWLHARTIPRKESTASLQSFRRALAAHVTGSDGRTPFERDEEEAILRALRVKKPWPCFAEAGLTEGQVGFRALGFYEKASGGPARAVRPRSRRTRSESSQRRKVLKVESSSEEDDVSSDHDDARQWTTSSQSASSPESEGSRNFYAMEEVKSAHDPSKFNAEELVKTSTWGRYAAQHAPNTAEFRQLSAHTAAYWLMQGFLVLIKRLGSEWLKQAHRMARYALIGFGMLGEAMTMEEAEAMVEEISAANPNHYVFAIDHASSDTQNRILAQNDIALAHFGPLSAKYGGSITMRVHVDDCPAMITTFALAYFSRGQVFRARMRLDCKNDFRPYDVNIFVHKTRRILIEYGRPVASTETLAV